MKKYRIKVVTTRGGISSYTPQKRVLRFFWLALVYPQESEYAARRHIHWEEESIKERNDRKIVQKGYIEGPY